MSMQEAILSFNEQFKYKPVIENSNNLKKSHKYIVLGMGGSHLGADLVLNWDPSLPVAVHSSYELPLQTPLSKGGSELIIASSYSGNTEEVVDGLQEAINRKLNLAVIATGGKLIEIAKEKNLPYIQMPQTGIQPRSALGFSTRAILKVMGLKAGLEETKKLAKKLKPEKLEPEGQKLAEKLNNKIPIIYASDRNKAIAYNWKIKFNETGKIPAFYNVFPELNHNEMAGWSALKNGKTGELKNMLELYHFVFLQDPDDHPRIIKRMEVTKKMFEQRGLPVEVIKLTGVKGFERIFKSLILADWAALHTAQIYGHEAEQVPMVEEFKKLITK